MMLLQRLENRNQRLRLASDLGQIVIIKCFILLWIKHFKHCGRRITPKIGTDLIELINNDYRIA